MNTSMSESGQIQESWDFELENMPGFEKAMHRVYAWYENEIIDRVPIRFMAHNAFLESETDALYHMSPEEGKTGGSTLSFRLIISQNQLMAKPFTEKLSQFIFPTSDRMYMLVFTAPS